MKLNRWTVNDRERVSLPQGMVENLYAMIEEYERKNHERNSYDKFSVNQHGSLELRYLKSLCDDLSWSGPGNQ